MSRDSASSIKPKNKIPMSSDEESVPEEWGSVQRRLEYLQTTMIKLQKRNQKLQKRMDTSEEEVAMFKKEIKKKIEQLIQEQNHQITLKEKELEIESIKEELGELHTFIKRIDKKNTDMFKELKNTGYKVDKDEGTNIDEIEERLEQKIERELLKNKNYIDKVVVELKNLIKEYVRDQAELQHKITFNANDLSRSNSKSKLVANNGKNLRTSCIEQINQKDVSMDKSKCKSPQNLNRDSNGSSRVNYLREKLKEFEQINKKYQQKAEKKIVPKQQEKRTVQKMKDFKNYLQQSQSQIQQSQFEIQQNNVLTDSIKKWRSGGQKYRME